MAKTAALVATAALAWACGVQAQTTAAPDDCKSLKDQQKFNACVKRKATKRSEVNPADAEPLTMQNFQLDADLEEEAARTGNNCMKYPVGEPTVCSGMPAPMIAGVLARSFLMLGFDNKVGSVSYSFNASDFATVRDAYKLKYPALQCSMSTVHNRMNAEFDQETCELSRGGRHLMLTKRFSSVDKANVSLSTDAFRTEIQRQKALKAQERQKDI